jgi:hypothetical protein
MNVGACTVQVTSDVVDLSVAETPSEKDGITFERPSRIVERTAASVAGAPLGRRDRSKIPARLGGILARSKRLPL